MPDREEQRAQEHLRQAQEERREADEGVRQAQEGVRNTRERVGDESRQSEEEGRVTHEGTRVTSESDRETSETDRVAAEKGREAAETRRETSRESERSDRSKLKTEFYVIYVVLFVCGVVAAVWGANQDARLRQEAMNREDQFCAGDEREHLGNVEQYRDTILYLKKLKKEDPTKLRDPLTQFVISRLPDTEDRARKDTAPPLCDKPGAEAERRGAEPVGLREPDPKIPKQSAEEVIKFLRVE